jgi:integrating conjugative element protein (TIGR03765 family)
MGMDPQSLTWFQQAADGLVEIGARGIVVQASNQSDWLDLQHKARQAGIDLMLLEGDALAQGYGITTYPVILIDPKTAEEGDHE